jgi:fucose permease
MKTGLTAGLVVTAAGLGCALIPGLAGVLAAAVGIGVGAAATATLAAGYAALSALVLLAPAAMYTRRNGDRTTQAT